MDSSSSHRQDTKVQFRPKATVREYLIPSEEDREASWYTREDFLLFRKEREETLQMIQTLGIQEAEERQFSITSIGIRESSNLCVRELRQDSKLFHVLREQQRQHEQGICDPEAIAASCQNTSVASSIEAWKEAQRVQQEASLEVYAEDKLGQALCSSAHNELSDHHFTPPPGMRKRAQPPRRRRALVAEHQPPLIPRRTFSGV